MIININIKKELKQKKTYGTFIELEE